MAIFFLFIDFRAFIGQKYIYILIVLLKGLLGKKNILELDVQMTVITKYGKRAGAAQSTLLCSYCTFRFRKND